MKISVFRRWFIFFFLVIYLDFTLICYFDTFNLIFRFKLYMIIKGIELRVHSPNINFIGWSCNCECLPNFNWLYGIVLYKPVLDNSEIIQWPAVIRIANVKVYKCLEIDHKVHNWEFFLKFLKIFFVLQFNCLFLLLLFKFVKVWLDSKVLIFYFFKVKFICLMEHIFRSIFFEIILSPTTLNYYCSLF